MIEERMHSCEHVKNPSESQWDQIQQIYEASFADYERDPIENIMSQVLDESLMLFVANDKHKIIGIAMLYKLSDVPAFYLPYFAMSPENRGKGVGSKFLTDILQYLSAQGTASALVWEIEPPDSNNTNDLRNKRARFYEKLGAKYVDMVPNYRIPLLDEIFPYLLYWLPLEGRDKPLSRAEVVGWIEGIYTIYYPESETLMREVIAEIR